MVDFKSYDWNNSRLGLFGEYIYKKYSESIGFEANFTNIGETDIELKKNEKIYLIDVKS